MNTVWKLVWPTVLVLVAKYLYLVLSQHSELIVRVLKLKVRQLHFVDKLFADLRADGNPANHTLLHDFQIWLELSRSETHIIHDHYDEFASEPVTNLLVRLAGATGKRRVVALFKEQHKASCLW